AQFASREVIDRLREIEEDAVTDPGVPVVLAASDPANPFGAAVPWPEVYGAGGDSPGGTGRPTRGAGALVIVQDGRLLAHLTRGGRSVLLFSRPTMGDEDGPGATDPADVQAVVTVLSSLISVGRLSPVTVEKVNGTEVMSLGAGTRAWTEAGARFTPKGLVVR
ncbi:MAG: DEAD/DEAH box helicase, partial [Corynebacterium variabile]